MTLKEQLNEHKQIVDEIKELRQELEMHDGLYGKSGQSLGVQSSRSSGNTSIERAAQKRLDIERRIDGLIIDAATIWNDIEPLLDGSLSPMERLAINARYKYGESWTDVARHAFGARPDFEGNMKSYRDNIRSTCVKAVRKISSQMQ